MSQHITKQQLINYVNRLGDSAEIETIEMHIADCRQCATRLHAAQQAHHESQR